MSAAAAGQYPECWSLLEARLEALSRTPAWLPGVPAWKGEPLAGPLLLNGVVEGYGDLLMGLRFPLEARSRAGAPLVLLAPRGMSRLAARCEGIDRVVTDRHDLPDVAAQVAPMSLPAILRVEPATMRGDRPYLAPEAELVESIRPAFDALTGIKVGITWQGNPNHPDDRRRSFPLDAMRPLAGMPGVRLVAIQRGDGAEQLADPPFPVETIGPRYEAGDWLDTLNIVSMFDLVIGPDSALAHLAGALGRPAWIALPKAAEWRWGRTGETTPWYSSVRLFRQRYPGEWRRVFERMGEDLRRLAAPLD